MKHLISVLILVSGMMVAPVQASAAPLVCSSANGLVYVLAASCAAANVDVMPGFTVGNCLVVQADFSLGGGACGGGGGSNFPTGITTGVPATDGPLAVVQGSTGFFTLGTEAGFGGVFALSSNAAPDFFECLQSDGSCLFTGALVQFSGGTAVHAVGTLNADAGITTGQPGVDGPFAVVSSAGGPVSFTTNSTTCNIFGTPGSVLCITDSVHGNILTIDNFGNLAVDETNASVAAAQLVAGSLGVLTSGPIELNVPSGIAINSSGPNVSYPWRPAVAPTCTVGAGGTTCNVAVTLPTTGMVCTANVTGTALLGGLIAEVEVSISGTTETITYNTPVWAAGGAVTFQNVCL